MATTNAMKTERLEARLPAEVKTLLTRAAALQGRSLTDFVVGSATETARRVVREYEVLALSERDQLAFAEALLAPSPTTEALNEAARRYRNERAGCRTAGWASGVPSSPWDPNTIVARSAVAWRRWTNAFRNGQARMSAAT